MRKKPLTNKWHKHSFGHFYVLPSSRVSLSVRKMKDKYFVSSINTGGDNVSIIYNGKKSYFQTLKSAKAACEQAALDYAKRIIDDINEPERELVLE